MEACTIESWVIEELGAVDLKDKRRNHRACRILNSFATIGDSTPDAVRSVAHLKATYRFMDMEQVTPATLLAPHRDRTLARISAQQRVLLVQDTTEVDLTRPERQIEGAGPLTSDYSSGFYLHPLIAFTDTGVPLGILDSHTWARTELAHHSSAAERRRSSYKRPLEQKESYRWVKMIRESKQIAVANVDTDIVCVADSESDLYELFAEFVDRPPNFHLLIRACHDRVVLDAETLSENPVSFESSSLESVLETCPVRLRTTVEVCARKKGSSTTKLARRKPRESRTAELEVRAATVTLRPPRRTKGVELPQVKLNVVQSKEVNPPENAEPIVWTLLTTLPIESNDLEQILTDYQQRWQIECFFMTLKSGMGIENLQYQKLDRYLNAVTLLMIVAWRVQQITQLARTAPDESCQEHFDSSQWKPIYMFAGKGPLPTQAPTNHQLLTLIAELGGYINKKSQGPPGTKTVWRGIQKLKILTEAFQVFQNAEKSCGV